MLLSWAKIDQRSHKDFHLEEESPNLIYQRMHRWSKKLWWFITSSSLYCTDVMYCVPCMIVLGLDNLVSCDTDKQKHWKTLVFLKYHKIMSSLLYPCFFVIFLLQLSARVGDFLYLFSVGLDHFIRVQTQYSVYLKIHTVFFGGTLWALWVFQSELKYAEKLSRKVRNGGC